MHRRLWLLLVLAGAVLAGGSLRLAFAQSGHAISAREAHQIVTLVARHDDIDLSDSHIELNSMDLGREFYPGFYSFVLIRESSSPGPDETLRRYAISRRTGDVWEMNLCTHYAFPELAHLQHSFSGRAAADAAEISAQSRRLGCSRQASSPAS